MSEPTPVEPTPAEPTPVQPEPTPAPEPVPEPTPAKSWVNEDGTFNRDSFGDELGKHSVFDKYPNVEEFVKGTINQNKLIGQKVDDWLGSDNEEIVKKRMQLAGVPDSADDYEITFPEGFTDLPEESRTSIETYLGDSAKWAHENGVSKDVFEKFVARDLGRALEIQQAQVAEAKEAFDAELNSVKSEWGNEYDNNKARAENMAKMLGMEEIVPVLQDNPNMMKAFFDGASKIMADDTIIEARQSQSLETVQDSIADLGEKMMEYEGSTGDAKYQRMVEKMAKLQNSLPKEPNDFPVLT